MGKESEVVPKATYSSANLKKWEKGQLGNPEGRPKNSNEQGLLKSLSRSDFMVLVNRILSAKPEELKEFKGQCLSFRLFQHYRKKYEKETVMPSLMSPIDSFEGQKSCRNS